MTNAADRERPAAFTELESDRSDVLGFVALAALADVELDGLVVVEGLVALAHDVRVMDENVIAALARDEAEALLAVEKLYSAL
jgi:hypothetical protein